MTQQNLAKALQSLCPNLEMPEEAAGALCSLVLKVLSGVVKDANSMAINSKRTAVELTDVNQALQLHGFEPLYGSSRFCNRDWLWSMGAKAVFFGQEREHLTSKLDNTSLPPTPVDVSVVPHWLAIDGVQPEIPENRATTLKHKKRASERNGDLPEKKGGFKFVLGSVVDEQVELGLPVVHVLSDEQQKCFKQIQNTVEASVPQEGLGSRRILEGISEDAALQPLVPYLVRYVTHQIHTRLQDTGVLYRSLHLIGNLTKNSNLEIERYGHQLLPCVLSCLLASDLGLPGTDDGWDLRKLAAVVTRLAVAVFGNAVNDLHGRLVRELCKCLEAGDRPLESQYGAIVGLYELSASSAGSVFNVLQVALRRFEESLQALDKTSKEYEKVVHCQSAIRKALRDRMPSPELVVGEDGAGEPLVEGIGVEQSEDLGD